MLTHDLRPGPGGAKHPISAGDQRKPHASPIRMVEFKERRQRWHVRKGERMRWVLAATMIIAMAMLASCDVFDSIQRPGDQIHMYGDAIDINSFQQLPKAQITVQIDNKMQHFTGSYDVMVPVSHPLVISASAPGYQQYQIKTVLNPQGNGELRSPLMLRPAGTP